MILLTGAAGFIGSNVLGALNARGRDDVIVVDDLADGTKCGNLSSRGFADYLDAEELRRWLAIDPARPGFDRHYWSIVRRLPRRAADPVKRQVRHDD